MIWNGFVTLTEIGDIDKFVFVLFCSFCFCLEECMY